MPTAQTSLTPKTTPRSILVNLEQAPRRRIPKTTPDTCPSPQPAFEMETTPKVKPIKMIKKAETGPCLMEWMREIHKAYSSEPKQIQKAKI